MQGRDNTQKTPGHGNGAMPRLSIAREAAATARRIAVAALCGTAAVIAAFVIDRVVYTETHSREDEKLLQAHVAAGNIRLADERLTMSANMAAATGERRWIERYEQSIPLIDGAIQSALQVAPNTTANQFTADTGLANDRLVELERQSLAAVEGGNLESARRILDGAAYQQNKQILTTGTDKFIAEIVQSVETDLAAARRQAMLSFCGVLLAALAGGALLWRLMLRTLSTSETTFHDAERQMNSLALHDALTGLPNRLALQDALRAAISRAKRRMGQLSVLMIDLDGFKPVNDRLGHLEGDLVLKEVARRLGAVLRDEEFRARFGGDEFVAVIEHGNDAWVAHSVGQRLIAALSKPILLDHGVANIGASVGIARFPVDATTELDLFRQADQALYCAKRRGGGTTVAYDSSMAAELAARSDMEGELRQALAAGDVVPWFQPIVNMESGAICGFEALARWRHAKRGVVMPAEFIPVVEHAGLMTELTFAMIRGVCRELHRIPEHLCVAINLSPDQLQNENLAAAFRQALAETNTPASRIEVELTETALISNLAVAKRVIASLKQLGMRISLDDFGTGYSNLCYLSELSFDRIKIDRTFVGTLHDRAESAKIIRAIVGLADSLGVSTVAEGVETERDAVALRRIGCRVAQGYLYSRPMPASDLDAALRAAPAPAFEIARSTAG
jgi:diguanylate cyclase (GGDEF)-like protein